MLFCKSRFDLQHHLSLRGHIYPYYRQISHALRKTLACILDESSTLMCHLKYQVHTNVAVLPKGCTLSMRYSKPQYMNYFKPHQCFKPMFDPFIRPFFTSIA